LIPRGIDRHPDHEAVPEIVKKWVFLAGLPKVELDGLIPHRPRLVLHYMIRENFEPDFVVWLDEDAFQKKMESFKTYHSQNEINAWAFSYFKWRMMKLWREIWKPYGEGYKLCHGKMGIHDFSDFFSRKF
jgi:LmbE family N-acetylglucosaminyl deacetylase